MEYTIGNLAEISKLATERVALEYAKFGWQNPPVVTIAMVEAVLDAKQIVMCGAQPAAQPAHD
jgi:hypothetical protein